MQKMRRVFIQQCTSNKRYPNCISNYDTVCFLFDIGLLISGVFSGSLVVNHLIVNHLMTELWNCDIKHKEKLVSRTYTYPF